MSGSVLLPAGRRAAEAQQWGRAFHNDMMRAYMMRHSLCTRPFLRDVVDELLEDELGTRVLIAPLPLDRHAQTELVRGKPVITLNSRTAEIWRVTDAAGELYLDRWHEGTHVARDLPALQQARARSSGATTEERLLLFRCAGRSPAEERTRELFAETAAHAAAICGTDMIRSRNFLEFLRTAPKRYPLGLQDVGRLQRTAHDIGLSWRALATGLRLFGLLLAPTRRDSTPIGYRLAPTFFDEVESL